MSDTIKWSGYLAIGITRPKQYGRDNPQNWRASAKLSVGTQ